MKVVVYVCPTKGCGSYYGASSAGDLSTKMNRDMKGDPTFARSRCPYCKEDRIPMTFEIEKPSP